MLLWLLICAWHVLIVQRPDNNCSLALLTTSLLSTSMQWTYSWCRSSIRQIPNNQAWPSQTWAAEFLTAWSLIKRVHAVGRQTGQTRLISSGITGRAHTKTRSNLRRCMVYLVETHAAQPIVYSTASPFERQSICTHMPDRQLMACSNAHLFCCL